MRSARSPLSSPRPPNGGIARAEDLAGAASTLADMADAAARVVSADELQETDVRTKRVEAAWQQAGQSSGARAAEWSGVILDKLLDCRDAPRRRPRGRDAAQPAAGPLDGAAALESSITRARAYSRPLPRGQCHHPPERVL